MSWPFTYVKSRASGACPRCEYINKQARICGLVALVAGPLVAGHGLAQLDGFARMPAGVENEARMLE